MLGVKSLDADGGYEVVSSNGWSYGGGYGKLEGYPRERSQFVEIVEMK